MNRLLLFLGFIGLLIGPSRATEYIHEDNASPQVKAPADVVVSCDYWFSLSDLNDPTDPTFGRFVYGQSNIQKFKTYDRVCPSWCEYDRYLGYDPEIETEGKACQYYRRNYSPAHPGQKYPLVWGWDGYVNGATSAVEIRVDDRRECGTGLIIRTFTIDDRGLKYSDKQRIWVIDCNPFYVSDDCIDDDDDIEWPLFCQQPDPLDGCYADLSPDNPALGRPQIVPGADDQCNLISVSFEDDTITVEEGACLKVLRTWSVVDWCQYHPLKNPGKGKWEYFQVIKVRDKLDPEITCTIGDCHPAVKDTVDGKCYGYIELRAEGTDSCTNQDHLRYEYKIDLFDDGQGPLGGFDLRVGPLSKLDEAPAIQENEYAEFPDSVLNASGTYPLGEHRIKWFVEDGCANVELCDTTFEIKDCKAPTPYCKTGIITVIMPATQSIEMWASDLDDGSFDNCSDELIFSFSSDTSETNRVFDCDDIGVQEVEIWVTDQEGNQDYCKTMIEIQDPSENCPRTIITGRLVDENGQQFNMSGLTAQLFKNGRLIRSRDLDQEPFEFNIAGLTGQLTLSIEYNKSPLDGVSIADIVSITRSLLGKEDFTSQAKRMAADVNGDCRISVGDAAALAKVILGHDRDFNRYGLNTWSFIPVADPDYNSETHCVVEDTYVIDVNALLNSYDFMPVKTGDSSN